MGQQDEWGDSDKFEEFVDNDEGNSDVDRSTKDDDNLLEPRSAYRKLRCNEYQ